MIVWVGIDDTDTYDKGCTTYVMYNMLKEFLKTRGEWRIIDYPRLIRLNPNIPFKTRGNAAVSVGLNVDEPGEALELAEWAVDSYSHRVGKTSPGIVISTNNSEHWIYWKALTDVIPMDVAVRWMSRLGVIHRGGRGVIGALASVMADLRLDSTLELLAYSESTSKPRIPLSLVKRLNDSTIPLTFENMSDGHILIQPHGNDPVVFGIRGDSPYHVIHFASFLIDEIDIEPKWLIYLTNQATGHNLSSIVNKPYTTGYIEGSVSGMRQVGGGNIELNVGSTQVFTYRHYGFKSVDKATYLIAYGGVKPGISGLDLYMEGGVALMIKGVARNPKCPRCGGSLESTGRVGLLKCPKCGLITGLPRQVSYSSEVILEEPRSVEVRHLHKPITRVGLEGLVKVFNRPSLWII
ncbi:TiaS agmantine-binding domain-containing protein [Caldivirga sp.]|uniref:TiaS agmantine-binding domain-containing protein n=1 Tax=Caldivirga sp. TaxID=2080243 RepID=UPI003D14BBBB